MTSTTYRFRKHTLTPDRREDAEPLRYSMECRSCAENSEPAEEATDGTAWAADHLKANPGHLDYREHITRSYRFEPGEWLGLRERANDLSDP